MNVKHSGVTYECHVAVKCENDNYIKLYDENGVEIASFHDISDFSEFTISDGDFIAPCDCTMPIAQSAFSIGGRTITTNDWILSESGDSYYYEIESDLISDNTTTCNILLLFAEGTSLSYTGTQEAGKIVLSVSAAPLADIVIESIQIIRV